MRDCNGILVTETGAYLSQHSASGRIMTDDIRKQLSQKYCPRFGQLAVQFGFITEEQLIDALARQVREELNGNGHRLLGEILFEIEVMSAKAIDEVMTELFRRMRQERNDSGNSTSGPMDKSQ